MTLNPVKGGKAGRMSACWCPRTPGRMTAAAFSVPAPATPLSRGPQRGPQRSVALRPRLAAGLPLLLKLEREGTSRNVSARRRPRMETLTYDQRMRLATRLTPSSSMMKATPPHSQGMDLLPVLDSALSTPPVVYALTAKYQVPLDRLFTV